jgi:chromate transporter
LKALLSLFISFFKLGLFTFGGGYAMLPLLERECVDKKGWITRDDMLELTVLAESTPGSIAVNCATYVGYRQKGVAGAVCATLGVVLPSFAVIFAISVFFDRFLEIAWVKSAFRGIKIAVGLLIVDAAVRMLKKTPKKALPIGILCASFAAMLLINIFAWRFSSVNLILIAAAVGACAYAFTAVLRRKGDAA